MWRVKLGWLDYKGPGEIDWRGKEKGKGKQTQLEPVTISAAPAARPQHSNRTSSPTLSSDDEFGDFFDGGVEEERNQGGSEKAGTDDGFGDFQDGDFTADGGGDTPTDPFGLSDGFTDQVKLEPSKSKPPKKAPDDLLLMFDDDDDEDDLIANSAPTLDKPRRPPAVTNLTFDTQPTFPSPPLVTSRPSAFAFNPSTPSPTTPTAPSPNYLQTYQTYHSLLLPYYSSLITHTTSSLVFTTPALSPMTRAQLLSSLSRFCHPFLAPTRSLPQRLTVLRNVQSAMDFFESALLSEFENADTMKDEGVMRDKAKVLWELNTSNSLSQIFVQKREIFYDQSYNPLKNLT